MKAKRNNTGRKLNTGIIKDFLFLFFIIGVYFASVCFLGFENTNVKLLTLVFYAIIGFVSFYLVFILARIVSDLVKKNKNLAKISNKIEHDGYLYDSDSKPFKYNIKKSIGENFTALLDVCFSEVKYVSDLASNDGRYGYLNFTMADALDFSNDSLSQIESKIDEALNKLPLSGVKDLPIGVLESALKKLIEEETPKKNHKGFWGKAVNKAVGVGIKVFFENKLNGAVKYVTNKAYLIYLKNGNKKIKVKKKQRNEEVENG